LTYAANLGVDLNDYVEISSFTHHPYYTQFVIEIPDNWSSDAVYNVPLADLEAITDNAIANNYGIEWASDVSEKYFSFKNGLAILPEKNWVDMTQAERDSSFLNPVKQMKEITPEFRQEAFDNQTTQDDHGMHIVGSAKDQLGVKYYIVKNSWGTDGNDMGGYFYCSKPYFLYKTTGIMVNKKAIPKDIAKKMGISI
jgi:bleomycin hydrolase